MKKNLIVIFFLTNILGLFSQTFEGKLVYEITFRVDEDRANKLGISVDEMLKMLKKKEDFADTITYYIKDGNYIQEDNSKKRIKKIFRSHENIIYYFEKESNYVVLHNAEYNNSLGLDLGEFRVSNPDSSKTILGKKCSLVKLTWDDFANEFYWYDSNILKVNPLLFVNHNVDGLNNLLNFTNSWPFEKTISINNFVTITTTLVYFQKMDINDSMFNIPELRKSRRRKFQFIKNLEGYDVMKIK
jgi:hypothetical protein